ncbi:hypothetical protein GCM10027418_07220 [Mariniluteicoccus endophyticus]
MFPRFPLGELTLKIGSGITPRGGASVYKTAGTALIRSQNVLDNGMTDEGLVFVGPELADQMRGSAVEEEDVLLNITGDSVARCAFAPATWLPARVNQHVAIIRCGRRLNGRFLQRALVEPSMKQHLLSISAGGTRKALTKAMIEELLVPVPPLAEQEAIAEVLGALDDKIAANRHLSEAIKALARAIVLEACASGQVAVVEEIADFHNNERKPLSASQRTARQGPIPYWGANGCLDHVDHALFNMPIVLIGEDGSVADAAGKAVVHHVWGPCWVNNHAHVVTGKGMSTELLFILMRELDVSHAITGAVQPKLSMGNLKKLTVRRPAAAQVEDVERKIGPLVERFRAATDEAVKLAKLRDTLLPALMDGRLRVRDAIKQAEEVL